MVGATFAKQDKDKLWNKMWTAMKDKNERDKSFVDAGKPLE